MPILSSTRVLVFVALGTLASVGLVVATSPKTSAPRPDTAPSRAVVDCASLDRLLDACAVSIAAVVDPEVPEHLARMEPALRNAVVSAMIDELRTRVGAACRQQQGRSPEGPQVSACLEKATTAEKAPCPTPADAPKAGPETCATWRTAQACNALAQCLKDAFSRLPPPRTDPAQTR